LTDVVEAPEDPRDGSLVEEDGTDAASAPGSAEIGDLVPATGDETAPMSLFGEAIDLELPDGCRTVVVSDLHLPAVATPTSTTVADELASVLGQCTGPAAFIIAGDGFEMLAGPPDVGRILDAHPQFTRCV